MAREKLLENNGIGNFVYLCKFICWRAFAHFELK